MNTLNSQTTEELSRRYQKLNEQKIRAQSSLEHAEERLAKLKSHAVETWGTDDIQILEKMLQEMHESNEKKKLDYQKHLDEIEQQLAQIDQNG